MTWVVPAGQYMNDVVSFDQDIDVLQDAAYKLIITLKIKNKGK